MERYQKLLDEAEARENDELGLGGPEGGETAAPSADDVRRLRLEVLQYSYTMTADAISGLANLTLIPSRSLRVLIPSTLMKMKRKC